MRTGSGLALAAAGLLAGLGACFGSNNPPPSLPDTDAAATDDGAASPIDGTLPDAGSDAPLEAPAPEAAPDVSSLLDAPQDATTDAGDAGAEGSPLEAAADAGGGFVRVADMAPDVPSIDFCVKASTAASFGPPYMHQQGGSLAVPYESASEYDSLAAAAGYVVRLVAGGSSDCSTALVPDVDVGPSPSTASTTIVLHGTAGDGGTPLQALTLTDDDPQTSPAGQTRMRAVHVAPGVGAASYQIGVAPYTEALQTGVGYGAAFTPATAVSGGPTPDANGYIAPGYGQAQVTLLLAGVETTSFYVGSGNAPTASATAFLVGASGSASNPLGFVECDELGTPDPATHLSPCTFSSAAPATTPIRVFHGAPDQGAVELCAGLGPSAQPFSANLLQTAGVSGGLAFGQLTGDLVAMPVGTDIKIGFIEQGMTCATGGQFLTVGTGLPSGEWTFAMFESALPPSTNYDAYLFGTGITPNAGVALVDIANLTPQGDPTIDVYATGSASSEALIGDALRPQATSGAGGLSADTYSIRVADDSTTSDLLSATGVLLSVDETYLFWWIQGSAAQGVLARCPQSQRAASAVTACPH